MVQKNSSAGKQVWARSHIDKDLLPVSEFLQVEAVSWCLYNFSHQLRTKSQNMSLWGTIQIQTIMHVFFIMATLMFSVKVQLLEKNVKDVADSLNREEI